jgi:ribose transport system permease protein
MKKILGIATLLLVIALFTTWLSRDPETGAYTFLSAYNLENMLQRIGLYGVLSIAAAFVIVTGGIDLSIGSVVCVAGCMLPWLLRDVGCSPWLAVPAVLLLTAAIGLWHGLLVVGLGLQPFVVTLCGLLLYRGVMRALTHDQTMGFGGTAEGLRWLATAKLPLTSGFGLPVPLLVLAVVATATSVLWTRTVGGRHLFALGRNEEAARFAGIATGRLTVRTGQLRHVLRAVRDRRGGARRRRAARRGGPGDGRRARGLTDAAAAEHDQPELPEQPARVRGRRRGDPRRGGGRRRGAAIPAGPALTRGQSACSSAQRIAIAAG